LGDRIVHAASSIPLGQSVTASHRCCKLMHRDFVRLLSHFNWFSVQPKTLNDNNKKICINSTHSNLKYLVILIRLRWLGNQRRSRKALKGRYEYGTSTRFRPSLQDSLPYRCIFEQVRFLRSLSQGIISNLYLNPTNRLLSRSLDLKSNDYFLQFYQWC